MKKLNVLIVLLLVLSMIFSGCGTNEADNQDSSSKENVPSETSDQANDADEDKEVDEEPAVDEEVKLEGTVTVWVEAAVKDIFKQFAKRFEDRHPGVTVELTTTDQNILIAAGEAPDLIKTGDLHIAATKDLFLDLKPYMERDEEEVQRADFFPNAVDSLVFDEKQLGLPTFFNVGLLYYNKGMFDAAGIDYPNDSWTQQDFLEAAKTLTVQDGDTYTQWGTSTVLGWWGEWLIHVRQAGGDWMIDDKCVLDSKEAIEGLQLFYDKTTSGTHKIAPSIIDDALGGFAGGKTAMEYGGHTGLWVSYNSTEGLEWDIATLPEGIARKDGAEFAVDAYGIYNDSENKEAAWAFLKFLTGQEGAELMADLGRPVARQSVADKLLATPMEERTSPKNVEALYAAVENGMTLPSDPNFIPCTLQVVQPLVDQMLEGKLTAEETGTQAAEKANEYLEANK